MTAPIHVVFVSLLSMSIVSVSAAETSSCEAFEVEPDGSVTVVKATALATPYGKISQPGMRFSSKVKLMGFDVLRALRADLSRTTGFAALDAVMGPALSGQLMWLSSDR
jgi:hypothetical protein